MTTTKVRKGSVRTIQEDAAEPAWVLASNRRFSGGEQGAQHRLVQADADRLLLAEGHGAGSRALRFPDVLAPGPGHLGALRAAGPGKVRREQRGIAQGA